MDQEQLGLSGKTGTMNRRRVSKKPSTQTGTDSTMVLESNASGTCSSLFGGGSELHFLRAIFRCLGRSKRDFKVFLRAKAAREV